nr:beta-1,3-glucan-binding protein 1-like [Onthophagus taurus]
MSWLRFGLVLQLIICPVFCQFVFPDVIIQAYNPKGLRIYVEARPDIKLFVFEGKINEKIEGTAPGDISVDIKTPTDGKFSYYDGDLQLNVGDTIYYWVYVQSDKAGFTRLDRSWKVTSLLNPQQDCMDTRTVVAGSGKPICQGNIIFEDDFSNGVIDSSLWSVEQYIPLYTEDNYEFVSYQDINQCRFVRDSKLFLKPIIVGENDILGTLDLTKGCTRSNKHACFHQQIGSNIIPPIKSGKIVSKLAFKYGKVEIRAKVPVGDWIYPQIELVPDDPSKQYPKFLIAYTRGNERLTLVNGFDLGSTLLFGGYANSSQEPERSTSLPSIRVTSPIGSDMNVFTLIWSPNQIELLLNGEVYGTIPKSFNLDNYRISLGVGVGGNVDFPDGVLSGSFRKPWRNNVIKQAKAFFDEKSTWASTWKGDDVALQVDYVKVYAI